MRTAAWRRGRGMWVVWSLAGGAWAIVSPHARAQAQCQTVWHGESNTANHRPATRIASRATPASTLQVATTRAVPSNALGPCYANCDGSTGSPALSVNDFVCFQAEFAAGAAYADCDRNGALNVSDFVCFQSVLATGCR